MRPVVQLLSRQSLAWVKRSQWPRSRSVSAPSSVTKTSPCWKGDIVPGSTLRYGSNFCSETFSPRLSMRQPIEAAASPLPREDTTPPVTKMYFAAMPSSDVWICAAGESIPNASQNRGPLALAGQRNQGGACRGAQSIMDGFHGHDKVALIVFLCITRHLLLVLGSR